MLSESIPGFAQLKIANLVLDMTGALTVNGEWIAGVPEQLRHLAEHPTIHILIAHTYGVARDRVVDLPVRLTVPQAVDQGRQRAACIAQLGAEHCVASGNAGLAFP